MALTVPNEGEQKILEALVNKTAPETLVLRLFTNNYTPVEASTGASFTEATGSGYSSVSLTGASWAAATAGDPSYTTYPEVTFTFTGALGNVYGYYITQTTSGKVMWAEVFTGGPFNVQNNGDQIKVTPRIEMS
jgi:hypothetical protein